MKKSLVLSMIVGMGIGFPVTLVCMIAIGGFQPMMTEFLVWMAASALFGLLSCLIFNRKEELPLLLALALHCVGCMAIVLGAVVICGYITGVVDFLLGVLPVFVVVYAVIYGAMVLTMKLNEKRVNEKLNKA